MIRDRKGRRKRNSFSGGEDVDPMNHVGNLSDVMLVLAVGMMLALVAAWNVDLVGDAPNMASASYSGTIELESSPESVQSTSDATDEQILEENGLTEYGTVYIDQDGNLYVLGVTDDDE